MRKTRVYEYTCHCHAYSFPHRFGGGKCNGAYIAASEWPNNLACLSCIENSWETCAVADGREKGHACLIVQELIHVNEIRPPKKWGKFL